MNIAKEKMEKTEFDALPEELKQRVRKLYADSLDIKSVPADKNQGLEYAGWCEALEAVFGKENLVKPVRTWTDLCKRGSVKDVEIRIANGLAIRHDVGIEVEAYLVICQLMPYYGGFVSAKEWAMPDVRKFVIRPATPQCRWNAPGDGTLEKVIASDIKKYEVKEVRNRCRFQRLAFHTKQQAEDFLKYNPDLIESFYRL